MDLSDREIDALELLAYGPSSFAALYYWLRFQCGYSDVGVTDVFVQLQQMERDSLVRAMQMEPDGAFRTPIAADYERAKRQYVQMLPQATASEVSVDEVGLWYEITESGRKAWSRWSESNGDDRDHWMLDDRADQGILEIRAERKDVAEAVLDRWLAEHDEVQEVPGTRECVKIPEFIMRDGTRVFGGVLVTCRYRSGKHKDKR